MTAGKSELPHALSTSIEPKIIMRLSILATQSAPARERYSSVCGYLTGSIRQEKSGVSGWKRRKSENVMDSRVFTGALSPVGAHPGRSAADARCQRPCTAVWWTKRNGPAAPGWREGLRRYPADGWRRSGAARVAWCLLAGSGEPAAPANASESSEGTNDRPVRRGNSCMVGSSANGHASRYC